MDKAEKPTKREMIITVIDNGGIVKQSIKNSGYSNYEMLGFLYALINSIAFDLREDKQDDA